MAVEVIRKVIGGVWRTVVEDPGGNGGSSPARNVGQTELDFSGLVVNNALVAIPFTFGNGDAAMIDLTDPTTPLPVAAGIYAYTLSVSQAGGGGDGSAFTATLVVDDDYYSINATEGHEPQSVGQGRSGAAVVISVTWFCTAGSGFFAHINSAGNDTYQGSLYVQKIA